MKAVMHHPAANPTSYKNNTHGLSVANPWHKFINWADNQQRNRFLWTAISLLGHGTVFTIATFITVLLTGNVFTLLLASIFSMAMVVIVNLAALPTKYTIPVLFLSLIMDVAIMITAISLWLK